MFMETLIFVLAIVLCTMSSPNEKAKIVQFVHESGSIIAAQRRFRLEMNKPAPERHSIRRWVNQFQTTGTVLKGKSTGRPKKSLERMNVVRDAFTKSPKKSIRRGEAELGIPRSSVHRILHSELKF